MLLLHLLLQLSFHILIHNPIGPNDQAGARITSLSTFKKHLDYFQSRGYHEVDTARMYINGAQESWTRDAGYVQRGLKLATKVYPEVDGMHAPDELRRHVEISLSELGTSCVDIFYLHAPDRTIPFTDTMCEVDKLYREGKFKQLGLSNYAAWEVAEIWNVAKERGWVLPTVYQAMYNVLSTSEPPASLRQLR